MVIMRRFELEPFLANIEYFAINDLILVPPIVIAIIVRNLTTEGSSSQNFRSYTVQTRTEPYSTDV